MEVLTNLPVEISHEVLIYISTDNIVALWNSSSRLRSVMKNNYFWKIKCKREQFEESLDPLRYKIFQKYLTKCSLYWQKIYICGVLNNQLDFNWENTIYEKTIIASKDYIRSLDYLDDEIAIGTNFLTNNIITIDLTTGKIEETYKAREGIKQVIKSGDFLIALVNDRILIVWDMKSKSLLLERDFGDYVLIKCVHKHRVGLYIASNDVVILNVITNSFEAKIYSGICIDFNDDDKFAVGSMDDHVKLFDSNCNIIWNFVCCPDRVITDVKVTKEHLLVYHFGVICFWNIESQENIRTIFGILHLNSYNHLKFINENTVLLRKQPTMEDCWIEVYNFVTGETIFKIDVDETTYDITANNNYLFGLKKNYIYIWCIETGTFIDRIKTWKTFTLFHSTNMRLFVTETKIAYLLAYKDLHILNYDDNIEEIDLIV